MNVLVTGATGLVGNALAEKLVARGDRVRALVRDKARAAPILPPSVELVEGDVTAKESVARAMVGIEWVFHAAGMPEQWQRDDGIFDRVNRGGTVNVLSAALDAKVKRVVYTSTMDVFAAPRGGTLVETNLDEQPKPTAYERSKQAAERDAEVIRKKGLDVVYTNPSAVYGPSPAHVSLNSFFIRLLNHKVPLVPPGGMAVVYVDGVADAHIAAMERGVSGERYLLADTYATMEELARIIARHGGLKSVPPTSPGWLASALAAVSAPIARTFGIEPLIAPGQASFMMWQARVDATKAQRALGFVPCPLEEGIAKTVTFLRANRLVP